MVKKFADNKQAQAQLTAMQQVAKTTPFLKPMHLTDMLQGELDGYVEGQVTGDTLQPITFKDKKGEEQNVCILEIILDDKDYKVSFNWKQQEKLEELLESGLGSIIMCHHTVNGRPVPNAYDITFMDKGGDIAFVKVTSMQPVYEAGTNFDVRGIHFRK